MFPEITFIVYDLTLSWGKKIRKIARVEFYMVLFTNMERQAPLQGSSLGFIFVH